MAMENSERHIKDGSYFIIAPTTSTFDSLYSKEGMKNQVVKTYKAKNKHGDSQYNHRPSKSKKQSFIPFINQLQSLSNYGSTTFPSNPTYNVDEQLRYNLIT